MSALAPHRFRRPARLAACAALAVLAGCARPDMPTGISDPIEAQNRETHALNKALDRNLVRPAAMAYGTAVPTPLRRGVGNFASNLSLPGEVVNSLLQLRPGDAAQNTTRFLINSTIGIAGLFDPASAMGATEVETDFGETLHVWGVAEGNYIELPVLGPSTGRDALGRVVDIAMNPLRHLPRADQRESAAGVGVLSALGTRHDRRDIIDSILYDSADSYAQSRQVYLQNRRFKLRRQDDPGYVDPYEDPYATPDAQ